MILSQQAGGLIVKFGLEFITANGVDACSELAADYNTAWVADAKLHDIPKTITGAMETYTE